MSSPLLSQHLLSASLCTHNNVTQVMHLLGVFNMNSDNHQDWTKTLFRPHSLYPDLSRLCPDPFQMACRVHLKCVYSDQFWWDFASLLTRDFICELTDGCKMEKIMREKNCSGCLVFALMGIGKLTVLKLCHTTKHNM